MPAIRSITPQIARRMAVVRQRLDAGRPTANGHGILDVTRDLGCLQLDPTSAVARSHLLVLWSRLGPYNRDHLERLLWHDRHLFEYWAHAASIVLTEDYPIHADLMQRYGTSDDDWGKRSRGWVAENSELRDSILNKLEQNGPMSSKDFEDKTAVNWHSTGWTSGRNVNKMLDYLWTQGRIMVARRQGNSRYWDLAERCLPDWTPRAPLPQPEMVRQAAQRSLRALGVARMAHINRHFIRQRYPGLKHELERLEKDGHISRIQIVEEGRIWPGVWYGHRDDLPLIDQLERGDWQPQTTLLSPFDNLICDRARTEELFQFYFRIEIYVPKHQRQYGYFVMPILHGDRLIGGVDPLLDRKNQTLHINAVHAEPDAPVTTETGHEIRAALESLASFLGARNIAYPDQIPGGWKSALT